MTSPTTRWEAEMNEGARRAYRDRFDRLRTSGEDADGEARFLDAMLARCSTVLDAGCGTGRVAAALTRRGHRAVGVDRDAGLVAAAREWYPETPYLVSDLLELTADRLRAAGLPEQFDLVALPGNVLVFVAPGTERQVLANLATLVRPGGRLVAAFATDRAYTVTDLDTDFAGLELTLEHRFATWDLEPWSDDAGWSVHVLRVA